MTHDDTADQIETDIAAERKALADSLSDLTDQFAPERLVQTVSDAVRSHGGDLVDGAVRGARENPVAVGLIGAGLAWLVLGGSRRTDVAEPKGDAPTAANAVAREASDAGSATRTAMSRARDSAERTAAQMRAALHDGTQGLSDVARDRVIAAREQALRAQTRIEAAARTASAGGQRLFVDQPLLVGAAVAAVGAAAALALPRTRLEDAQFGAQRDSLVQEAERIWHEEVARARKMGSAVLDEAGEMANEAAAAVPEGEDLVETTEETLRDAADRLADRAKQAARS